MILIDRYGNIRSVRMSSKRYVKQEEAAIWKKRKRQLLMKLRRQKEG